MTDKTPWYEGYEDRRATLDKLRLEFSTRCEELGAEPLTALREVNNAIVAKTVHESNWQEGIELNPNRTRELSEAAIEALDLNDVSTGPHLDMKGILVNHRRRVLAMIRQKLNNDDLAAYNLAVAHQGIRWMAVDLGQRFVAAIAQLLMRVKETSKEFPENAKGRDEFHAIGQKGSSIVDTLKASKALVSLPMTHKVTTEGELTTALLNEKYEDVFSPLKPHHLQFLHKILFCGLLEVRRSGTFRKTAVHVGNPDLEFPPWQTVPKLIEEYCDQFPPLLPNVQFDPILKAAQKSHRFTVIHPFADGNGRISRMIMNLILVGTGHPIVYLKADKKGRHRYITALKRADRGNIKPLACLLCASIEEVYGRLLFAVGRSSSSPR